MPKSSEKPFHQLTSEAERIAKFHFGPAQQKAWLEQECCRVDGEFTVIAMNRFVPIDALPGSAAMLRKFVRGGGNGLDTAGTALLKEYWRELELGAKELSAALESGESASTIKGRARTRETWPAVGVIDSESDMRSLLWIQFEAIRQNKIAWRCVDSSTYVRRTPGGVYVLVDWFWHGY